MSRRSDRKRGSDHAASRPDLDPEILEVLQDEPELLAIADALRATRAQNQTRRASRRRSKLSVPRARLALGAAAAVAVAVGLLLVVTHVGGGDQLRLVDNAQAALLGKPVTHAVVIRSLDSDAVVRLSTGQTSATVVRVDVWVDAANERVVSRTSRNGKTVAVSDRAAKAAAAAARASLDARASALIAAYRTALAQRRLVIISARQRVLGFHGPHGISASVVLGANYLPRRIVPNRGPSIDLAAVQPQETTPRLSTMQVGSAKGSVVDERPATRVMALAAVRGSRDLGPSLAGLPLNSTLIQRLVRLIGGRSVFSHGVAFEYGSLSGRFLELREARDPEPAYMYRDGRTIAGNPIPAAGALDIHRFSSPGAGSLWFGQMRAGQVYVTLRASSRPLLVAAARALIANS